MRAAKKKRRRVGERLSGREEGESEGDTFMMVTPIRDSGYMIVMLAMVGAASAFD